MKRLFSFGFAAIAMAAVAGLAVAAEDYQEQREALMKDNGAQATVGGRMAQGAAPFDAAAAKAAMEKLAANAAATPALFPPGSEGGDSLPAIWENFADFEAKAAAMEAAANAAAAAADEGLEAFGPAFAAVGQSCGACHQTYRKPRA